MIALTPDLYNHLLLVNGLAQTMQKRYRRGSVDAVQIQDSVDAVRRQILLPGFGAGFRMKDR